MSARQAGVPAGGHAVVHPVPAAPILKLLLGLAVVLALAGPAAETARAAAPVVVGQDLQQPDRLTVGDRFHLIVTLEADAGTSVAIAPGSLPATLSLAQRPVATARSRDGRQELRIDIELAAFAPGELQVPALRLAYREASGATGEITTRAFSLRIESVLTSADLEPRDLKPQVAVEATGGTAVWPFLAGAFAALLLLGGAAYYLRRRALSRRPTPLPEPVAAAREEGPEDRARHALDAAAPAFARDHDYVAYYSLIAETVRGYLTERYGFPAFALTTSELQAQMVDRGMDRWQARLVAGLLTQCDSVLYAFYRPAEERADADLTAAYEIVEMSRPEPAHEAELVGAGAP